MTTTRFLALCATAILVIASTLTGCGGENGQSTTEDVFVGTDNGTDTSVDDSTAMETNEEIADDPCEIYYPLEGSIWICHAAYDFTCTLQVDVADTWCRIWCPDGQISYPSNDLSFSPPLPTTPTSFVAPLGAEPFTCNRQEE